MVELSDPLVPIVKPLNTNGAVVSARIVWGLAVAASTLASSPPGMMLDVPIPPFRMAAIDAMGPLWSAAVCKGPSVRGVKLKSDPLMFKSYYTLLKRSLPKEVIGVSVEFNRLINPSMFKPKLPLPELTLNLELRLRITRSAQVAGPEVEIDAQVITGQAHGRGIDR